MKWKLLATVLALFSLWGCGTKETAVTELHFNRGHGSAWGNQFRIEVNAREVVFAEYVSSETGELVTVSHIPVSDAQWQALLSLLEQLPLEKARSDAWEFNKLDGGEFRELTLLRGGKKTEYAWPNVPQAQELEQFLENLIR